MYKHLESVYRPCDPTMADYFKELAWSIEHDQEEVFLRIVEAIQYRLRVQKFNREKW